MLEQTLSKILEKLSQYEDLIVLGEVKGNLFPIEITKIENLSRTIINIFYYKRYCKLGLDNFIIEDMLYSKDNLKSILDLIIHEIKRKIYGSIGLPEISYSLDYSNSPEHYMFINKCENISRPYTAAEFKKQFLEARCGLFKGILFKLNENTERRILTTYINGIGYNKKDICIYGKIYNPGKALVLNLDYIRPIHQNSSLTCDFSLYWGGLDMRKPKKYTKTQVCYGLTNL